MGLQDCRAAGCQGCRAVGLWDWTALGTQTFNGFQRKLGRSKQTTENADSNPSDDVVAWPDEVAQACASTHSWVRQTLHVYDDARIREDARAGSPPLGLP